VRLLSAILLCVAAAHAAGRPELWHDPGLVERLDLRYGAGGAALRPRPPFRFVEKEKSGSTEKVRVRDSAGRQWVVKFGEEASPDTFASRLAWSVGYTTSVNYYVPRGAIRGYGRFAGGRFQLRSPTPRYLDGVSWSWEKNPFVGTPQLNGLKVLMMLLSNWDNKDSRDLWRGSNNSVFRDGSRYLYFVDDWGGSMGRAGNVFTRSKWDAGDFYRQSSKFVRVKDGELDWGYHGAHTDSMTDDIRVSDIRWLLRYLGRISDAQLRAALLSSGATRAEASLYVKALRFRIRQLQLVTSARSGQRGLASRQPAPSSPYRPVAARPPMR
jgi:hypothetical protein